MLRVIVPLDFSESAMIALQSGLALANKLKANLRIVHVKAKQSYATGYDVHASADDPVALLDRVLLDNRQAYYVEGGKFDYKVREGNAADELINQAKYDDATLVVMGSHGVSGISKSWIGGVAYKLISNAPCPVLVIRSDMQYDNKFQRIAVTVDLSKNSRIKVPVVAGVAKTLGATAVVLGIQRSSWRAIFDRITLSIRQVEKYLVNKAGVTVESSTLITGKDVDGRLLEAIAASNADMVAVDVTNTGFFFMDRFRPFLTTLINNAKCPVLAIPVKE